MLHSSQSRSRTSAGVFSERSEPDQHRRCTYGTHKSQHATTIDRDTKTSIAGPETDRAWRSADFRHNKAACNMTQRMREHKANGLRMVKCATRSSRECRRRLVRARKRVRSAGAACCRATPRHTPERGRLSSAIDCAHKTCTRTHPQKATEAAEARP